MVGSFLRAAVGGHLRSEGSTRSLVFLDARQTPLPTGEWGRPVKTRRRRMSGRVEPRDIRYSGPPPPPPPVVMRTSAQAWLRGRRLEVILELLLAIAIVAAIAVAFGGAAPGHSRSSDSHQARTWAGRAQAVSVALIDDLATIDSATRANGVDIQSGIASAERRLMTDEVQARSLGVPGRALAPSWASVLRAVDVVILEGSRAPAGQIQSTSEDAINALVRFVAAMEQNRTE